jgi:uncharacterized protein YdhG (YjbR/CyaY superfamily)
MVPRIKICCIQSIEEVEPFASFMNHVSLFPMTSGVRAFKTRLAKFTHGKGSIQFPLDHPLPVALIRQIVKFRVSENRKKSKA